MVKFKKGDRVIATTDGYYHKKSEKGIIDEHDSTCPYVKWDNGKIDATNEGDLEFLEESIQSNYQIY